MFDNLTTSQKWFLAAVAILLFPAGPFLALLMLIAMQIAAKKA